MTHCHHPDSARAPANGVTIQDSLPGAPPAGSSTSSTGRVVMGSWGVEHRVGPCHLWEEQGNPAPLAVWMLHPHASTLLGLVASRHMGFITPALHTTKAIRAALWVLT